MIPEVPHVRRRATLSPNELMDGPSPLLGMAKVNCASTKLRKELSNELKSSGKIALI
jgi:hypothetical protein